MARKPRLYATRDLLRQLEVEGWIRRPGKGDHVVFKHPTKPGRVTVPHPKRDVPVGTFRSIEKQAGLKLK